MPLIGKALCRQLAQDTGPPVGLHWTEALGMGWIKLDQQIVQ